MTSLRSIPIIRVVCVAGVLATGAACGRSAPQEESVHTDAHEEAHEGTPAAVELSEEAFKRAGIEDEPVRDTGGDHVLLAPASLELNADRMARVGPRVAGRVQRVIARLGDHVRAGDSLATIWSPEAAEATAALAGARADQRVAERAFARERDLLARKVSAQREVLEAEAALANATAAVTAAEARLAAMGLSGIAADDTALESVVTITSPLTGTVVARDIALDAPVGPDSVLFTVADLTTLWLTIKLPEANAGRVAPGQAVRVTVGGPARLLDGRVAYVAPVVDPDTRAVDVRIELPNPAGALRAGMSATARLDLPVRDVAAETASRVFVPRAAIQDLNQASVVFVPDGERRYRVQPVTLGAVYGREVEVLSGLTPGTRVVVRGAFTLKAQALRGAVADPH